MWSPAYLTPPVYVPLVMSPCQPPAVKSIQSVHGNTLPSHQVNTLLDDGNMLEKVSRMYQSNKHTSRYWYHIYIYIDLVNPPLNDEYIIEQTFKNAYL